MLIFHSGVLKVLGPPEWTINLGVGLKSIKKRLHKSRSSRSELEFDLSNFV